MTILMENEQELDLGFDYEKVLKLVIEKALEQEKCPYECEKYKQGIQGTGCSDRCTFVSDG